MPVTIIEADERLSLTIEGSVFYYHRLGLEMTEIQRECLNDKGKLDERKLMVEVLKVSVLDWENVLGGDGNPIPFTVDLLLCLPSAVLNALFTSIMSNSPVNQPEVEADLKN